MIDPADSFAGCLLGGAVGDALGAPFEGLWSHSIPSSPDLLSGFASFEGYPTGQYTDDTQLTIATIRSIVENRGIAFDDIARSIAELWRTQSVIGPGGACTAAAHRFLRTGDWTSCGAPKGQAGNGTAMRTAAVGLFFVRTPRELPDAVAGISRITHSDPRSVAGGVAVAKAAQLLGTISEIDPIAFCNSIAEATAGYDETFARLITGIGVHVVHDSDELPEELVWAGMPRPEFERPIITPFVIPTVLASLWVVLRFGNSWPAGVAKAIRLGGDVDTLGAIVGALLGTRLGVSAIPLHLRQSVVDSREILLLARQYYALVA